ncbi:MAG: hypothetical protein HQM16_16535 [Deltaproteobacteria bacterium]|nr:hypothetical protein [Deltaproteobacteria bacterium]
MGIHAGSPEGHDKAAKKEKDKSPPPKEFNRKENLQKERELRKEIEKVKEEKFKKSEDAFRGLLNKQLGDFVVDAYKANKLEYKEFKMENQADRLKNERHSEDEKRVKEIEKQEKKEKTETSAPSKDVPKGSN